jgi:hypothetical protein
MVPGRLRTRRMVVDDRGSGLCPGGGQGGWSGRVCGVVVCRLPNPAKAAAGSD